MLLYQFKSDFYRLTTEWTEPS